jgi:hypothetical protein
MRRSSMVILLAACVLAGGLAVFGGAAKVQAGPRLLDITVTPAPSPGQQGRRVAFNVFIQNISDHPLTQTGYRGIALSGGVFDDYSSSRGSCQANPDNSAQVDCTFGKLRPQQFVNLTVVYNLPLTGNSVPLDSTAFSTEQGGDPGSPSQFHPSPNPTPLAVEAQVPTKVSDVLDSTGGTRQTDPVTQLTKRTSTKLTVPSTLDFEPIVISEVSTVPTLCGGAATPKLESSQVTAPGTFNVTPLTIVLDFRKNALPGVQVGDLVGCHDGVRLNLCPASGPLPAVGCQQGPAVEAIVDGVQVYRLTMQGPFNGTWGGGV